MCEILKLNFDYFKKLKAKKYYRKNLTSKMKRKSSFN